MFQETALAAQKAPFPEKVPLHCRQAQDPYSEPEKLKVLYQKHTPFAEKINWQAWHVPAAAAIDSRSLCKYSFPPLRPDIQSGIVPAHILCPLSLQL